MIRWGMFTYCANYIRKFQLALGLAPFPKLRQRYIPLESYDELKKVYGWKSEPDLNFPFLDEFLHIEDINKRRLLDAMMLGGAVKNAPPGICLEIGTSTGQSTALMARNSPGGVIYTVNIPEEEVAGGKGGTLTTYAPNTQVIGSYYRSLGLKNIHQIIANTATWKPDFEPIEVAFIDGCHDTPFVYHDSLLALSKMKSGSYILWHDFAPDQTERFPHLYWPCLAIEMLIIRGIISGPIFSIKNSWTGIFRLP